MLFLCFYASVTVGVWLKSCLTLLKTLVRDPSALRTCSGINFPFYTQPLILTCLAKKNQAGSYMWIIVKLWILVTETILHIRFKAYYNTDVNKYSSCKNQTQVYFFLVINNYISFVKIDLPKLPKTTLKYKNLFCQTSKNRDSYTRVFTVIIYRESRWGVRNQFFLKISQISPVR